MNGVEWNSQAEGGSKNGNFMMSPTPGSFPESDRFVLSGSPWISPPISVAPAASTDVRLQRIRTSRHFASPISETRLRTGIPYLGQGVDGVCTVAGVGCAQRIHEKDGAGTKCVESFTIPVDALGMFLLPIALNRTLGIPEANFVLVIGSGAAKRSLEISQQRATRTDRIARIATGYKQLASRLMDAGIQMQVVVDEDLFGTPDYQAIEEHRLRSGPDSDTYGVIQDATVEYLYQHFGVRFKVGWTTKYTATNFDTMEEVPPGCCEGNADTRLARFHQNTYGREVVASAYGPAAASMSAEYETGIPYCVSEQSKDCRIHLDPGESVASKVPGLEGHKRGKVKALIRAYRRLYDLCDLVDEVLPGVLPPIPPALRSDVETSLATVLSERTALQEMKARKRALDEMKGVSADRIVESRGLKKGIPDLEGKISTRVKALAALQRKAAIPRVQCLVDTFGVSLPR